MVLVIRSNYGDDSIALIEAIRKQATFDKIWVVYIDTGWAAAHWHERVAKGEDYVRACGFEPVQLKARASFSEIVAERKNFPSRKFQWCAGFLKGLPLLEWLDEHDPHCAWRIALPKRQALYRQELPEIKKECEYHGERDVWHPILSATDEQRDAWVKQAGFDCLHTRSLECEPCINSRADELERMSWSDQTKMQSLELKIGKPMFPTSKTHRLKKTSHRMDVFSMGCGDPFGCGL